MADHKNHNILDDRKHNLRPATNGQNQHNQIPQIGTSKYKGIHWNKKNKKWMALIKISGVRKYLGLFVDEATAANAYDEAAKKLHGEFIYHVF